MNKQARSDIRKKLRVLNHAYESGFWTTHL